MLSLNLLLTDFKLKDEFDFFRNIITKIKEVNGERLSQIVAQLPMPKQNFLKHVLQSFRVQVDEKSKGTVARKIVTVKSKKNAEDLISKDNQMSDA